MIYRAYDKANQDYDKALTASIDTTEQLNETSAKLDRAKVKLTSLEAAYAAANAAALAS